MNKSYKVLLVGGLFLLNFARAEIFYADVFIFKIGDSVFSMQDLKKTNENMEALKCYYPDSLLTAVFSDLLKLGKNKGIFEVKDYTKESYSQLQKDYFKKFIEYSKLKMYSESHKVPVAKEISKAFYLASRQLNCNQNIFQEKSDFTEEFLQVMKVEVFLRTRYLPEESSGKKTPADVKQALIGIKNLLNSIDKQISEETYW